MTYPVYSTLYLQTVKPRSSAVCIGFIVLESVLVNSSSAYIDWQATQAASAAVCVQPPHVSATACERAGLWQNRNSPDTLTLVHCPSFLCSTSFHPDCTSCWTLLRVVLQRSTATAWGASWTPFSPLGTNPAKKSTVTALQCCFHLSNRVEKRAQHSRGFGWGDNAVPLCRKLFYCFAAWGLRYPECSAVMDLLERRACAKSQTNTQSTADLSHNVCVSIFTSGICKPSHFNQIYMCVYV